MKFTLFVAKRYFLTRKTHNAIHIIAIISLCGVCIGTMALVCIMSVFNGFGKMVENMFSSFDSDLKISLAEGKSFSVDKKEFESIKNMSNVSYFTNVVEENALFKFKGRQETGVVKGVDETFVTAVDLQKICIDGTCLLKDKSFDCASIGLGLAAKLGAGAYFLDPLYVYAPKKNERVNLTNPKNSFNTDYIFISSVFSVKQSDYDSKYAVMPISFVRNLFNYSDFEVTAVEIMLKNNTNLNETKNEIKSILGERYDVLDKYEQQEDYYKIMKVEKWVTFLILCFIILIAIFNIVGSLSMLIIEKKKDVKILYNLGANESIIRKIFWVEGSLISIVGAFIGVILGSILCLIQEKVGLIKIPGNENLAIVAYPIDLELLDVFIILLVVCVMGMLIAYYPVRNINIEQNE